MINVRPEDAEKAGIGLYEWIKEDGINASAALLSYLQFHKVPEEVLAKFEPYLPRHGKADEVRITRYIDGYRLMSIQDPKTKSKMFTTAVRMFGSPPEVYEDMAKVIEAWS